MTFVPAILFAMLTMGWVGIAVAKGDQGHTCQGGHNCNEGGSNGQSTNTNSNQATANSASDSNATSSSGATSNSGASSNSSGNSVDVSGGQSTSSSSSGGGSAQSNSGDSVSSSVSAGGQGGSSSASGGKGGQGGSSVATGGTAAGGQATVNSEGNSTGNVSVDMNGGETSLDVQLQGATVTTNNNQSAHQASSVYVGECQRGMSGQVEGGGFNIVNSDQFCEHVKAANLMLDAYNWEVENGDYQCVTIEYGFTTPDGVEEIVGPPAPLCTSEKALGYLASYRHHIEAANQLVQRTEVVGFVDRISGYLVRPFALIAVLILLI